MAKALILALESDSVQNDFDLNELKDLRDQYPKDEVLKQEINVFFNTPQ